jgi:alpha-tubulin suppressor-like RCC1 family protein
VRTVIVGIGNLLVWIFLAANVFAQSGPPGGQDGGTTNCDSPLYVTPDYGTNLWLSINLSNSAVQLLLHNTQPGVPYLIRSRENLASGSWSDAGTVTGAVAATATPATLNAGEPTKSLFIQALTWMTNVAGATTVMTAIGGERIMELTADGDVISRGGNQYGELGDYTFLDSTNPIHVAGLTNIRKIASGLNHSLALDSDGAVWAWGQNGDGQLGDGGTEDANLPVQARGMTNSAVAVAGGYCHSVAAKADGMVWTWGKNNYGQLGTGDTDDTRDPVLVQGLTNAVAVAAGYFHSVVLLNNGTVWAWGDDSFNQLGDGNWETSLTPAQVPGLCNIVAICAAGNHNLALDTNGRVWVWGMNDVYHPDILFNHSNVTGKFANADADDTDGWPAMVGGLTNVISIAAGTSHSLALDSDGRLWAWGRNGSGQLGVGGYDDSDLPMQVLDVTNIVSIAAGSDASAALDGNGNLWQWGDSDSSGMNWPWGDEKELPAPAPRYADFYNGQLPDLQILNGNNQVPHAGLEFPQPLVFKVTDANGMALSNAPVSVEIVMGDMELRNASGGGDYKGLRLTTDAKGEMTLIGYADRHASNTNCLIRVLAASRERIAEADFSETLVPLPTINITSPENGSTYLVASNQPLTIMVDAEAAPGASIKAVDYSYHINDGEETSLGIATQNPYSFTWTNALWWADVFVCQYTLSAVAVDDAGAHSDPQSVNITVALDSDGNGLPDYWQLQYFGHLGVDPNADPDGDDISNLQEYQQSTDPTDFYNGRLPCLEIVGGNDQAGNYDAFLSEPVTIKVMGTSGFSNPFALINAPVTFTVTNGTALLASTTNDLPGSTLVLRSDSNGQVSARIYFPPSTSNPPDSTILVSTFSGTNSIAVTVNEFVPLAHWRFDNTNTWVGEQGQLPLLAANIAGVPSWSSNAVAVDDVNPALLSYHVVETHGRTNINCQVGSVLFWFKPGWSSTNVGGNGPGAWGRLIEMGNYNPAFTNGWWSLYLSPDGSQLLFGTSTNGNGMTNLSATISWYSNEWYQVALTYSPTGSALYVDGQLLANGAGVLCFPNAGESASGFRIGSDQDGNNQAAGAFDELETFNYPLAPANAATFSSEIPDWWEIKYFGRAGMDPDYQPDNDGFSLLINYQRGRYPNVINFSLTTANCYVTNGLVPAQIHLEGGVPFGMSVAVITTNFVVVPNQLFDINGIFAATPWQPYNSNMVVSLNSGDGDYYVWVGLKGISPDAEPTWHGIRLTVDTAPPILTITNPANGMVSRPVIQMQGCANESLSSLTYDLSNAAGVWTNQTGYVTEQFCDTNLLAITTNYFQCYNVALTSNGVNLITLHAADLVGNTTTTNIVVTFDASANTNPPALTVLWPQSGTSISGTNFTLQAQVSDPMTVIVASIVDASGNTNIVQGLVEQSGLVWVQNLPLASGTNTLTITATDAAGNTSVTNLTLFQSGVIVTMNPLPADQLGQPSVSVGGTVSDPGCAVTVNGVVATVNPDGTWEADNVPASSSGTAIFDVEAYSGSAPGLVRANPDVTPMDAPSGGNAGSQLFDMTLPVKVGLMSYLSHIGSHGVIAGGSYAAVNPCCGPAFGNSEDTINWTYLAGGSETGYDYSSGYFNCPPGSPGWIMLSAPKNSVWGNPIPRGKDAYGAPWECVSETEYYFQAHVMIEPQGQIAAGSTATYLVQAQAWDFKGGGPLPSYSLRIGGMMLTDDGTGSGYVIFSAPAGVNVEVTPMAQYSSYAFSVQATELGLKLAVDNNRDGHINFDNSDLTTPAKPYRFWINDSQEHGDDETSGGADDQIPGIAFTNAVQPEYPNYRRFQVQGRSDLVNFFPVALNFGNALQSLPPSEGYEYHLYQADCAPIGGAVKFVYTSLTRDNAFSYLTDANSSGYGTNFNESAMEADTIPVYPDATLDTNWLAHVQNSGGTGIILLEGCAATPHPLMLEIWRNGRLLAGIPLYLSISGVEQMFRHVNFSYVNGTVEVPARADAPNEPDTNDKYFVFLHGYNVNQQEARGVLSEMFKRMYWSGSKAKFYGVTWNGAESKGTFPFYNLFTPNYHTNVVNALRTAPHLASFLNGLSGETTVAAHSLGNMVVLSAISDYNATIGHYIMVDAAVPMEALQGDMACNPNMLYSTWNPYANRLFASDWWQIFTNDYRGMLTWSNRVGNLQNVDIYNFYSSGEEVLREYDSDPPNTVLSGVGTELLKLHIWDDLPFGIYAWVWQEKGKGSCSQDWFIGSSHGGWRFSYYWRDSFGNPLSPSIMNDTPNSILQNQPMFSVGSSLNGPPDDDLVGDDASAYAQANRDRILSDAIPALTLPVGANFVRVLGADNNFDMQASFENGWPATRPTAGDEAFKWYHSDFDYVAYPFTYKLFNKVVSLGKLEGL